MKSQSVTIQIKSFIIITFSMCAADYSLERQGIIYFSFLDLATAIFESQR